MMGTGPPGGQQIDALLYQLDAVARRDMRPVPVVLDLPPTGVVSPATTGDLPDGDAEGEGAALRDSS